MPRKNYPKNRPKSPTANTKRPGILINQETSCRSKRRFATQKLAQKDLEIRELQNPNLQLRTYACQWCGGWHLTRNRQ